jgi:hypothetical protein
VFESLVNEIYDSVSSKLWLMLRDQLGFSRFLQAMRNIYLMGKGEFFQSIIDGILEISNNTPFSAMDVEDDGIVEPIKSSTIHSRKLADAKSAQLYSSLDSTVMRTTAKLLNLDEESLANLLSLRVNNPNVRLDLSVPSEGWRKGPTGAAANVVLTGIAAFENINISPTTSTSSPEIPRSNITSLSLTAFYSRNIMQDAVMSKFFDILRLNSQSTVNSLDPKSTESVISPPSYAVGGLALPDSKYIAKGFSSAISFYCDWSAVISTVSASHPWFSTINADYEDSAAGFASPLNPHKAKKGPPSLMKVSKSLMIGSLALLLHTDKHGPTAVGADDMGISVPGSVAVGVSFYGE